MNGVLVDRELLEARIREELERNWQAMPYATPHGMAASLAAALALPAQAAADAAGVQADREALQGVLMEVEKLGQLTEGMQARMTILIPLATEAAGVLRQVALMAEAIQTADRLPEGSEDRRWAFTDYVNVESRLRREDPARLRALADALEMQG